MTRLLRIGLIALILAVSVLSGCGYEEEGGNPIEFIDTEQALNIGLFRNINEGKRDQM